MTSTINLTDPTRTCRTCSENWNLSEMYPIFKEDSHPNDMFTTSLSHLTEFLFNNLKIQMFDGLPQKVCSNCVEKMKTMQQFYEHAENSRDSLEKIFKDHIKLKSHKPEIEFMNVEKFEYLEHAESAVVEAENQEEDVSSMGDNDNFQDDDSDYEPEQDVKKPENTIKRVVTQRCTSKSRSQESNSSEKQEVVQKNQKSGKKHKNFDCEMCDKKYKRERDLIRHLATKHEQEKVQPITTTKEEDTVLDSIAELSEKTEDSSIGIDLKIECTKEENIEDINISSSEKEDAPTENIPDSSSPDAQTEDPKQSSHACHICDKTFSTAWNRRIHLQTHNKEDKFKCDICEKSFKCKPNLYTHKKNVHGISKHVCPHCNAKFNDTPKFKYHVRTHDKTKTEPTEASHECLTCGKTYSTPQSLRNHEKLHTGLKPHLCSFCGAAFAQKCNLKNHLKVHTGEKQYKCNICEKEFSYRNTYVLHMQKHTGNRPRPYICEHCGKDYAENVALRIHLRTHTGEKPFKCDSCDSAFAQRGHLFYHKSAYHGGPISIKDAYLTEPIVVPPRPVFVEKINVETTSAAANATGGGTKKLPFVCTVCNKGFKLPFGLSKHFNKMHTEARTFACTQCPSAFKRKRVLENHIRVVHLKIRPFSCQVCSKTFSQTGDLNIHMRQHTGEKPFTCTICNRSFSIQRVLRHHMRIHTGEKAYKCEICGEGFVHYKVMASHQRLKHKNWTSCSVDELQKNLMETGNTGEAYSAVL